MTDIVHPVFVPGAPVSVQARVPLRFTGVQHITPTSAGDQRALTNTHGTILNNNVVKVKPDPESPELPMPGARVSLHEVHDGTVVWVGMSDKNGKYSPSNLTPGQTYFVAALDLSGQFEAVAAGPVVPEAKLWND